LVNERRIMTRIIAIMVVALIGISMEASAMDNEWFQTWDRPEYQEWAIEIPEGYLLHIIRREKTDWLIVQAKLIMGDKGLPGFEVVKQHSAPSEQMAFNCLNSWKLEQSPCIN
jgi:hypothetical protein